MPQFTTESIWHFIGYLHLADILSAPAIHYSGGAGYTPIRIEVGPYRAPSAGIEPVPASEGAPAAIGYFPWPEAELVLHQPRVWLNPHRHFGDGHDAWSLKMPRITTTPSPAGWSIVKDPVPYVVSLEYKDVLSHYQIVDVDQVNGLVDHDHFGLPVGTPPIDTIHTLETLIGRAEAAIPQGAHDSGWRPDNVERIDAAGEDGAEPNPLRIDTGGEEGVEAPEAANGRHVDGELTDAEVTPRQASSEVVADMRTSVRIARGQDPEPEPSRTVTGEEEAVAIAGPDADAGPVTLASDGTPTGGYAQTVVAGGNHLVNVAILEDYSESLGSSIVVGDRHETNSIVQINVFQGRDATGTGVADLVQQQIGPPTELRNEAVILDEQGVAYPQQLYAGNLEWHVTYMQGSYWDLTTVRQTNVMLDNDIALQTGTESHFVLTQGENGAINYTQLLERADAYDLVIVSGNYYELNSILQINVVLDDDVIIHHGQAGSRIALGDGNELFNHAVIINVGGEEYKPLSGEALRLAERIGDHADAAELFAPPGKMGGGPGPLNVLFIDGDYFNHNVLIQTNVLSDVDVVAQIGTGKDSHDLDQTAETGGNTATNLALLINYDSLSDFQYVGGTTYEENVLVQIDIIVADADEPVGSDLHPDVVAAIAALSDQDDVDTGRHHRSDDDCEHDSGGGDVDVLGGVIH